jgi:hypothetical protein
MLTTGTHPLGFLACFLDPWATDTMVYTRTWNQMVLLTLYVGVEYWTYVDPSSATTTRQCASDGEDPTCSASVPFTGINGEHIVVCNVRSFHHIFVDNYVH